MHVAELQEVRARAKAPGAPATPAGQTLQPPRPQPPSLRTGSERGAPSVIGPDLIITGNLVSKGEMQIDGEVQGTQAPMTAT